MISDKRSERLTDARERDAKIFKLIGEGLSSRTVGERFGLTPDNVRGICMRLRRKQSGRTMIYIAIDPGLTGAIAAIDDEAQLILCTDLPVTRDNKLAWIDANDLTSILLDCRQGRPARIAVERSQPMPGQGVSSTFTTGVVVGSILAACQRIAVPLTLVTAALWKRSMGLDSSKSLSLDKARLLFPAADLDRKKDHNRAEALLLAEYSRRTLTANRESA